MWEEREVSNKIEEPEKWAPTEGGKEGRKENLGPLLHICLSYCKKQSLVYNIEMLIVILS